MVKLLNQPTPPENWQLAPEKWWKRILSIFNGRAVQLQGCKKNGGPVERPVAQWSKPVLVVLYIGLYYTVIWGLLSHYKDPLITNQHFNAQLPSGVSHQPLNSLQVTLRFDPTVVKLVLLADLGWVFPRDLGMGWLPLTSTTFSFSTETFDVFGWMIIFGRFFAGCKQQRGRKWQHKAMAFGGVKSMKVGRQNPCSWRYLVLLPQCLVRLAFGKENRIWGQYLAAREITDKHVLKHFEACLTQQNQTNNASCGSSTSGASFFKINKAGWFIAQRITLNNHWPFLTSLCDRAKLEEAEPRFQWSGEELLCSPLKWATFKTLATWIPL